MHGKLKKFYCNVCFYSTHNRFDFFKHCNTNKHKQAIAFVHGLNKREKKEEGGGTKKEEGGGTKKEETTEANTHLIVPVSHQCETCGKAFKKNSGLWRHVQQKRHHPCTGPQENIMSLLLEQNKTIQLQQDVISNLIKHTQTAAVPTTSHAHYYQNKFNLNVFLNETCKEAVNISDFVHSIKVDLNDLELTGELGFVDGISSVIIRHLNQLQTNHRPIHCNDHKRESFYVKNNNQWTKENEDKPLLTQAIVTIANQNIAQIPVWCDEHPDSRDLTASSNDQYHSIVCNSMYSKDTFGPIFSKLAKHTTINKGMIAN